jgi:hypothetical protein
VAVDLLESVCRLGCIVIFSGYFCRRWIDLLGVGSNLAICFVTEIKRLSSNVYSRILQYFLIILSQMGFAFNGQNAKPDQTETIER